MAAQDSGGEPSKGLRDNCTGLVLVVDDDAVNRRVLVRPLKMAGFTILEAGDGEQALEVLTKQWPQAVLLDVMMPGLDGVETCRRIKSNPRTQSLPVLMVTALSEREARMKCIQAGANDFLTKPVDVQEITLRVRNAVQAKQLFDALQVEKARSDNLLLSVLPRAIADRMKQGELDIADVHPDATVLIASLRGVSELSSHIPPEQAVYLLNEVFTSFDDACEKQGVEKIRTVGETYIAAGGLPVSSDDHPKAVAELALAMRDRIVSLNEQYHTAFQIRIRFDCGPVVAGVIGRKKFAYDLWGETVHRVRVPEAQWLGNIIEVGHAARERLVGDYQFDSGSNGMAQLVGRRASPAPSRELAAR